MCVNIDNNIDFDFPCIVAVLNRHNFTLDWQSHTEMNKHPLQLNLIDGNSEIAVTIQHEDKRLCTNIKFIELNNYKIKKITLERVILLSIKLELSQFLECKNNNL